MTSIASRLALIVTGVILMALMAVLASSRSDDCGTVDMPKRLANAAAENGPTPTLAPPQKFVFLRVESDKPDIQVGWAEN
jgi:hypothetical protein